MLDICSFYAVTHGSIARQSLFVFVLPLHIMAMATIYLNDTLFQYSDKATWLTNDVRDMKDKFVSCF